LINFRLIINKMGPPVRKIPAIHEIAIGAFRGHKITKHKSEKPFKTRPSRKTSVILLSFFFQIEIQFK
jgi:hypothetical protein